MTTISAIVVLKSWASGPTPEIVTLHLRYPRFIHAELITHRVFSRNARSSRAVPVHKMLKEIWYDGVSPLYWGSNQAGMQAGKELTGWRLWLMKKLWNTAKYAALGIGWTMMKVGAHKQIINRILEPFMHIDTLVTATEWENFFELREHKDAEPHIQDLAIAVRAAIECAEAQYLVHGQWHLPYITAEDCDAALTAPDETLDTDPSGIEKLIAISAARCARISYAPFDGDGSIEKELERYKLLVGSKPMHASPVEHQASPDVFKRSKWQNRSLHGNFVGWIQWRKLLETRHA
jgi:hypothetical protein